MEVTTVGSPYGLPPPNWLMVGTNLAMFSTMTLANLAKPEVQAQIIPLKTALEQWRDTDNTSSMIGRVTQLPNAHIPAVFVMRAYEVLTKSDSPFMIYSHRATFSAQEKLVLLEEDRVLIQKVLGAEFLPQPVKTVSLQFKVDKRTSTVLVTTIGDTRVEDYIKRDLAQLLGVSNKVMKSSKIVGDDVFDTTLRLGQIPGIVGPIVPGFSRVSIDGICYVMPEDSANTFVELAVSPIDSLILPAEVFLALLDEYAKQVYGAKRTETQSLIFYSWDK